MEKENKQLLKFTTAGNVDSGKSTLVGRLLYDSNSLFNDQINAVRKSSNTQTKLGLDLALFTDGLREERQRGITIDIAHRYFSTSKRKFVIIDSPGHTQYTRNMITGASMANVAIIIIDAIDGIGEQTKRHAYIAALLQIHHVVVCINKMDLTRYSEHAFDQLVEEFEALSRRMGIRDVQYIPLSALNGDNVVLRSENMNWYTGQPVLETLEHIEVNSDLDKGHLRFPIQTVIREESTQYCGYAGKLVSGVIQVGEIIIAQPSGKTTKIKSIHSGKECISSAFAPMSVVIELEDDLLLNRGDMIVGVNNLPQKQCNFEAVLYWMSEQPATDKAKYRLLHTSNEQEAGIEEVIYTHNMDTLQKTYGDTVLSMNTFAKVRIRAKQDLMLDAYAQNKGTGCIILVDIDTNETVAAGMII